MVVCCQSILLDSIYNVSEYKVSIAHSSCAQFPPTNYCTCGCPRPRHLRDVCKMSVFFFKKPAGTTSPPISSGAISGQTTWLSHFKAL